MGWAWKTRHFEGGTQWSEQQTAFDQLGRAWKTSNPYFPGASLEWTESKFDALGRVTEVKTPDGAKVTTTYLGTQVTVSDPANKTRRSETDALGRLKQVVEDPSGVNYATNYTYSTTGNLIRVEQGTQYRYFLYDSASRLLRARNPEQNTNSNLALTPPSDQSTGNTSWALKYVYDSNGNLTSKVDPRNVTTSYGYDALNRNIWTSYTDGTPGIERHYDAATNGKGRFYYHVSFNLHPVSGYAYSLTVVNAYDSMGRVTSQSQGLLNAAATQWYDYTATRSYDLAGHVTGQTYPSNRTVSYSYAASGRLSSFSGGIGDGVTRTYADTFSYNAAGQVTKERFGTTTNLYHNQAYNNRLQLVENRLGTDPNSSTTWNRGALINYYSNQARTANNQWLNATDNNGNVTRVQHFVPTADVPDPINNYAVPMIDDYDYDSLNRITLVTGKQQASSGSGWSSVYAQGYSYDQWGNRTINQAATYGTNINNTVYAVDTATNRLTAMTYDAAGNVITDTGNAREYDGENRMKKAWGGSQWNYYVYDSDGKRVRRIVGSTEYWQVYGLEGELIAEYPVNGTASTPQKEYGYRNGQMLIVAEGSKVQWTLADHLGTPRMVVDKSGRLFDDPATTTYDERLVRHDYLPFGEELLVGMGNSSIRSAAMGYVADTLRQKFTDKERDTETGLDYFSARYFASMQGRFTSVDPVLFVKSRFYDPQRINLYGYCRGNPMIFVDPDGADLVLANRTAQAQARANIDSTLRPSERANVRIRNNRVELINRNAINLAQASPGYKYLHQATATGHTYNYYGVSKGSTVTVDNQSYSYERVQASGGLTIITSGGNSTDVIIASGGGPDILGASGQMIAFPEHIVFAHELYGHGTCGSGLCAVTIENEVRTEAGLPLRDPNAPDHESNSQNRQGFMLTTAAPALLPSLAKSVF